MKHLSLLSVCILTMLFYSCNQKTSNQENSDSTKVVPAPISDRIKLDTLHSLVKNKNTASVPVYEISNPDSFYVDMKGYPFSSAYMDAPEYTRMLLVGGSFTYTDVIQKGVKLQISHAKAADSLMIVRKREVAFDEFKLVFTLFIDNSEQRMDTIDAFKIRVVKK